MSNNITDKFIDFLFDFRQEKKPDHIINIVKRCLLDYLGATLAGSKLLDMHRNDIEKNFFTSNGMTTVIGFNKKASIENAIFVNGFSSHIAELDDGVLSGIIHPGSPIFSSLLPNFETKQFSTNDFVSGIIIGYEGAIRISEAIQPSHKKKGYHATGTCGTIGAALAIATMLGYSKSKMKNALASASVSAAGTLKVLEEGSELKPLNSANAALNGFNSARIANSGFVGPKESLIGDNGFVRMMSNEYDLSKLIRKADDPYAIEKVYFKPYAACRYCHPAIDATIKIRNGYSINPIDIEHMEILTDDWIIKNHDHKEINGSSSAKMSIPYSVAVSLLYGKAFIDEFSDEVIRNLAVRTITHKILITPIENKFTTNPHNNKAIVKIFTADGKCFSEEVSNTKGGIENPMTDDEIKEKFTQLALFAGKTSNESKEIIKLVWELDENLSELFNWL